MTWIVRTVVVLALLGLLPPAASAQSAGTTGIKISPVLQAAMTADPLRPQAVIVEMQHAPLPSGGVPNADLAQRALSLVQLYGQPVGALPIVGSAAGWVNAAGIQALSQAPGVAFIHSDATVQPRRNPNAGPPRPNAVDSLYTREVHADRVWPSSQGTGVTVAVLDSGVAADADLGSRLLGWVSFASQRSGFQDAGGHGTHVAGMIAGSGARSNGEYVGIAPGANIYDVQVLDSRGNGRLSSVIAGLDWVLSHRRQYNIRVANLSIGTPPITASYHADLLSAAVEMVWHAGVVVVAAAGNTGPARNTVESPGIDPYVVTVGALDDQATLPVADDVLAWFSAWGAPLDGQPKPDVIAPGRRDVSLRVPGSMLDTLLADHVVVASNGATYFRLSGTSQACAVVSGLVALMLARNPLMTPDQVKAALTASVQPYGGMNALPDPTAAGSGLVDALGAVLGGPRGASNTGLRPSDGMARRAYPLIWGQPLVWRDPNYQGIPWALVTWQNIAWDNIAWDNIAWDNIAWDNIAWDNIAWDNIAWDNIAWDRANWDNIAWDSFNFD